MDAPGFFTSGIIALVFYAIGVGMIGYGIIRIVKIKFSNINSLPALVVDKRVDVRDLGQSVFARITYYVTLEFSDGGREVVEAKSKLYDEIKKDEAGVAFIRDRYLLDFRQMEQ